VESALEFAIQTARQAGELLLHYFQSKELETDLKADRTVVSEADLASDRFISQAIQDQYPNDILISEELQTFLYSDLDVQKSNLWVIDPLDGTTNFTLGLHLWGVLIARLEKGFPILSVLNFPFVNELYSAEQGRGAFLNDNPIHVRLPSPSHPFSFFACCSRTFRYYNVSIPYKARILGSSAYSYACVARGISVIGFEARPRIWDIAASWLLVTEAGGFIETYDESHPFPVQPGLQYAEKEFPTLAAASSELLARARNQIVLKTDN